MRACNRKRRGTVGGEARACTPATLPSPDLATAASHSHADELSENLTKIPDQTNDMNGAGLEMLPISKHEFRSPKIINKPARIDE